MASHLIYLCHHHISVTVPTIMSSAQTGGKVQCVKYLDSFVLTPYSIGKEAITMEVKVRTFRFNLRMLNHVETRVKM